MTYCIARIVMFYFIILDSSIKGKVLCTVAALKDCKTSTGSTPSEVMLK